MDEYIDVYKEGDTYIIYMKNSNNVETWFPSHPGSASFYGPEERTGFFKLKMEFWEFIDYADLYIGVEEYQRVTGVEFYKNIDNEDLIEWNEELQITDDIIFNLWDYLEKNYSDQIWEFFERHCEEEYPERDYDYDY